MPETIISRLWSRPANLPRELLGRRLLAELGDPQNNYLKVQVAGTNGKGSVCAFLRSICIEAGIQAGVYTSPHLTSITERINIGGVDISEDDFARFATTVRKTSEKLAADGEIDNIPTFFEQVTAIALLAFAEAKVHLAILETGLGGRLDATTAANAEIAVITRIDIDHQQYLGETIEEIAVEKAAVIRADTEMVVIGDQTSAVLTVINKQLRKITGGNPTGREGAPVVIDASRAHSLPLVFQPESLGLRGRHQVDNATVAAIIARALRSNFAVSDSQINAGLRNAHHPGRLEYIGDFLLDGAHNVAGTKALAAYLTEVGQRSITLIFGAMNDKNAAEMLSVLIPFAGNIILTEPSNSRAMSANALLAGISSDVADERLVRAGSVAEALDIARTMTPDDGIILVTGSLYLVGEARKILTKSY